MKKILIILTLIILLGGTYVGAWMFMKKEVDAAIVDAYANASRNGIAFMGAMPTLQGFPFVPTITYTDGIRINDTNISFSTMTISGYPVPGLPLTVSFPAGVIGWHEGRTDSIALQDLSITIKTPWPLPRTLDETGLTAWRDNGGDIVITDSHIEYESTHTQAEGIITLDGMMQPAATLTARMTGYAALVQSLVESGQLKPFAGIALVAALNNFTLPEPDEESGEMIAQLPLTVQNRGLYVGPVLVETFQPIVWGTRNPPAPHQ